ncbi:helix-turn-helix domain-containing protein [Allofustis seminis]|uniref:helix-turn-helix domain-containing protein n=1 Tax=Allofustis seminis TaxID=166939 RepID=UPI0003705337|nr:helix-turn-helix domain-containing protein [Allofustis seminis]
MSYSEKYILSFFNENVLKSNQLIHIFQGKRTPSILYRVEIQQLHPLFNLYPLVKKDALDGLFLKFERKNWIEQHEKGYRLMSEGTQITHAFCNQEKIYHVSHLRWNSYWHHFFEYWQFLTQIFSEASFANIRYRPVVTNHFIQEWVKRWLHLQQGTVHENSPQWQEELRHILSHLEETEANFISMHLSGHERIGWIRTQIMHELNEPLDKYAIYLNATVQKMMNIINYSTALPLHKNFLDNLKLLYYNGLSKSTWESLKYLQHNQSFFEVAKIRRIKVGTIYEHLLEAALIDPEFEFDCYIRPEVKYKIIQILQERPLLGFKSLKMEVPEVLFMEYRLVQLEQLRNKRKGINS